MQTETRARLVEMSDQAGSSLIDTVGDAAEALRRQRFAHRVTQQLEELATDPAAWADYVAESDATVVGDGIG